MTILVPTDFSKLSKVAVLYAARIAKELKANVIVIAVINMNTSSASSMNWNKLEEEMIKIANQDADLLLREVRSQINGKLDITYEYIKGYPVNNKIETYAVKNKVDLIIMGTKGASGLKKVIMGSNTASVIGSSSRPVIAVPEETEFKQIKKIVYATDMINVMEEIKTLAMFARIFNASIQVFHVLPSNSPIKIDSSKTVEDLVKQAKYAKISLTVIRNDHIAEAVEHFVEDQKADLLTMFTHKLDFFEKLFDKSVTRQLAFHARVPLLTFNKTTLL